MFGGTLILHQIHQFVRTSHKCKKLEKHLRRKKVTIAMLTIVATCFLLVSLLSSAFAINEVQFIFNNGFETSAGASCTSTEMSKIAAVFNDRRLLRSRDNTIAVVPRHLATSKAVCRDKCGEYITTCHHTGCQNFRELASDVPNEGERNLQISCPEDIASVHSQLDDVMKQVGASCKNWMDKSKRRATCFPDVTYGNVLGIKLWKISGTSQSGLSGIVNATGTVSFCKSVPINIEAITEPCVKSVHFDMTGPNSYDFEKVEEKPPYSIYGDDGTVLKGRLLSAVGTYNLWISPDYDIYKDQKKKYFKVVVNNC
jgi:hypothetical protein